MACGPIGLPIDLAKEQTAGVPCYRRLRYRRADRDATEPTWTLRINRPPRGPAARRPDADNRSMDADRQTA
ncbi:MAG: hypothetical protein EA381_06760 [Planctomycetaceae bacterium]|nr:MAG: hypothetical protein EA381_06760 [Planctomycetaceae bacterium]